MASYVTAYRVCTSFLDGKKDHSGAMSTDGQNIWTYGVKLAYKDSDGIIHTTPELHRGYSRTSNRHQNAVRTVVSPLIGTNYNSSAVNQWWK